MGAGRLYHSSYFPYAQSVPSADLNYIRNSIKVVIDAYNGSVDLYLVDPSDAVAATYQRIFPGLFKSFATMPQELQRHVRYPEELFLIQAQVYRAYHMDTPEVFYNREDLWQFPRQASEGDAAKMAPYYMIMRLPGEPQAETILMLPMVPSQRENMIAWLAARCDPLIMARWSSTSSRRTSWSTVRSRSRLASTRTRRSRSNSPFGISWDRGLSAGTCTLSRSRTPSSTCRPCICAPQRDRSELKRVIAAWRPGGHGGNARSGADGSLYGACPSWAARRCASPSLVGAPDDIRAREALGHYKEAMERLKAGDWQGFGAAMDRLRMVLERPSEPAGGR